MPIDKAKGVRLAAACGAVVAGNLRVAGIDAGAVGLRRLLVRPGDVGRLRPDRGLTMEEASAALGIHGDATRWLVRQGVLATIAGRGTTNVAEASVRLPGALRPRSRSGRLAGAVAEVHGRHARSGRHRRGVRPAGMPAGAVRARRRRAVPGRSPGGPRMRDRPGPIVTPARRRSERHRPRVASRMVPARASRGLGTRPPATRS